MNTVGADAPFDEMANRRRTLGEWLSDRMGELRIEPEGIAGQVGVEAAVVEGWLDGSVAMTFEQGMAVDRALELPLGTTGAAGGYFSFLATPSLEGEVVFDSHEYLKGQDVLGDLEAAIRLGLGVRLANRWEPVEVDYDEQSCVSEQRWTLDLMASPPSVDPFD